MIRLTIPLLAILLMSSSYALAAEAESSSESPTAASELYEGPVLPQPSVWPGEMIIIVIGMFVLAAIVGPVVRANAPEELPVTHSHDEPPGASHHHGHSGTHETEPGHGHGAHH